MKTKNYCRTRNDIMIIDVPKELDHHLSERIRKEADPLILERKIRLVILDFTATEFMDSSSIGLIMGRHYLLLRTHGQICVAGFSAQMKKVFLLSGLHRMIPEYATVSEAIEKMEAICS